MTALAAEAGFGSSDVPEKWVGIDAAAPVLAATMLAYLDQITVSMRPNSVRSTEADLRILAGFLIDHDPGWAVSLTLSVPMSKRSSSGNERSSARPASHSKQHRSDGGCRC